MVRQITFERVGRARAHQHIADLAIIGGGPACVALLHRLARVRPGTSLARIDVFEEQKRLGSGGPYELPDPALLMNTPISHLNVTGTARHLTDWLATCALPGARLSPSTCLPRFVYGQYLEHVGIAAIRGLASLQTQVAHRRYEIVDLSQVQANLFELTASDGSTFQARHVVLAVGDPAPARHAAFDGLQNYIDAPSRFAAMAAIPSEAAVIVLGAGASAVDCCLHLKHHCGHRGPVTLVSRSGQLPCVLSSHLPDEGVAHVNVSALLASPGSSLSLEQMVKAVERDLSAWLGGSVCMSSTLLVKRTPEQVFRRDVLRALRKLPGPQDYIRSLRRLAPEMWRRLVPSDRLLFDETYRSRWNRHRHPIPLEVARPLMHLLRSGEVRAAKALSAPYFRRGDFAAQTSGSPGEVVQAPYLIQATGLDLDATRDRSQLVRALLRRGLGCADPRGGLRVDAKLRLQKPEGEASGVYLLGSRTRGSIFTTASIQSIARASETVAEQLGEKWGQPETVAMSLQRSQS